MESEPHKSGKRNKVKNAARDAINAAGRKVKRRPKGEAGLPTMSAHSPDAEQASSIQNTEADRSSSLMYQPSVKTDGDPDSVKKPSGPGPAGLKPWAQIREGESSGVQAEREQLQTSFYNLDAELRKLDPEARGKGDKLADSTLPEIFEDIKPKTRDLSKDLIPEWVRDKGIPLIKVVKGITDLALEGAGMGTAKLALSSITIFLSWEEAADKHAKSVKESLAKLEEFGGVLEMVDGMSKELEDSKAGTELLISVLRLGLRIVELLVECLKFMRKNLFRKALEALVGEGEVESALQSLNDAISGYTMKNITMVRLMQEHRNRIGRYQQHLSEFQSSLLNPYTAHDDIVSGRVKDSGRWVIDSLEFQSWLTTTAKHHSLWCLGEGESSMPT